MKTVNHTSATEMTGSALKRTSRLGFWSAVLTVLCAVSAFALGITTPPRSGPFCLSACITYPYTDAAAFVPGDYLWMYPGILLCLTFFVLMTCIRYYTTEADKKLFSQIGLSFALISAALITMDYFIQLSVIQPSLLKGETEGLSLFSQYNPHGIFIALEDLGYVMMSFALLFLSAVFVKRARVEGAIRWLFIVSPVVSIGALIGLSLLYGRNLEYRYEVAVLTINWITLIVGGVLLAVLFKQTT
ncbi:MAG TPA: hypothetical protein VLX61_01410 [Anaerolineales bacterium]|nr:hypothetical protein [Anaerolineales bacterium]